MTQTNTDSGIETAAKSTGKATLVLGASLKRERHSNMAIRMLRDYDHPVLAVGGRNGEVLDVLVEKNRESVAGKEIHTVTLYMNAKRQAEYHDYILGLNPQRIIFNPGAENRALFQLAQEAEIEVLEACTLVMLSVGSY